MSNIDGMFNVITPKLGINDAAVIQKSKEFYRLLQNKGSLANANDFGKVVLCINVATTLISHPFDKDLAIKLSGMKKSIYNNTLYNIEKLLDLDKELTISEICVQFSCTVIKDLAESIWKQYKESHPALQDNNHPLYVVVSVYTACKLKKVKIDKQKLLSLSHSTSSQFKELENDFQKFAVSLDFNNKRKKKDTDDSNNMKCVEKNETVSVKSPTKETPEFEDYETWKQRILEESYKALKMET